MNQQVELNTTIMKIFLWSGVVLVGALVFAQGYMMGFVPGPSPAISAEELKAIFVERQDRILLGSLLQIITWCFYGTWAIPIIIFIRKMERAPVLTYASLVNIGGGWVFFILIPFTWAAIAYRAETLPPYVIQIMNDWVWFDWLYTWPSFAVWNLIIAAAILCDKNVPTIYPRWVGFFNIWVAFLISPAGLIAFFKEGPFAYDGLISFWFAVVIFFGWIIVMTVVTFQRIAVEEKLQASESIETTNAETSVT